MKRIQIILTFLLPISAFSQTEETPKYAIVANIGQQEDVVKFDVGALNVINKMPFSPRVEIGLERTWRAKRIFRFYQDLKLTFVNDPNIERVYGIGTDLGFEYKIFKRILLTPRLGVHYNRALPSDIHYVYENDKWVQTENSFEKNNRIFAKVGLDLGFKLNRNLDLFVNKQYSANFPHIKNVIPVYLNTANSIGIRNRF